MPTNPEPATSDFTRDVLGRFICNGLDEALRSTDPTIGRSDGPPQIEARDFDLIVLGGGTFGAVIAEHMSFRDRARRHRILVLEGGPLVLPEHVQNLPMLGLDVPGPTRIADLAPDPTQRRTVKARNEVWGLAWHSATAFPGLAYCLGGRSLYWGGWSPEPLGSELPAAWPATVVGDLTAAVLPGGAPGYFRQASEQIGTSETNDFIFGDLHTVLRQRLFDGLANSLVTDAVAFGDLPEHPAVRFATTPTPAELAALAGVPAGTLSPDAIKKQLKLEAPLAVQGRSGHAGFFPFNKFSTVPLLTKAAREAFAEAGTDDARKHLMIVPNCHVKRLTSVPDGAGWRVTEIVTNQGTVRVPADGSVIVALGTIESTRLVKESFENRFPASAGDRIGTNLMAHLRSNLNIRIPRTALPTLPAAVGALQASALFVKGRHLYSDGSGQGHFHLQITASGLGAIGGNSEAELFKKIPDIDTYDAHRHANDSHVAITIRGIGEMQPQNPGNRVTIDPEPDEFDVRRAFVVVANPRDANVRATNPRAARDFELWQTMDQAAMDVAKLFGVAQPPPPVPDGLGTTHHEAGTLRMGDPAGDSVTLPDCRLRHSTNVYAAGPALFPTTGSPNPMLTGVALARRLGDVLATSSADQPDPGFTMLFSGFDRGNWRMTTIRNQPNRDNPGSMRVIDGSLETVAGSDMGIFWCTIPTPPNFILKLQWLRWSQCANSGVYLRFPDPDSKGYDNTAYVADDFGFEVQIDECGDIPVHRTGAIYRKDNRTDHEVLNQKPARPVGQWNDYEIRVDGQKYSVKLNGDPVCNFDNTNLYAGRGVASQPGAPAYIGLQVYARPDSLVRFRRIQIASI